jgi:hypothetical protein
MAFKSSLVVLAILLKSPLENFFDDFGSVIKHGNYDLNLLVILFCVLT